MCVCVIAVAPEFATKKDVMELRSRIMQARRAMESDYNDKLGRTKVELDFLKQELVGLRQELRDS